MRLIDADALIEDLKEHKIPFNADVNEAIIVAPTIDVEPIRHGHWINEHFTKEFDGSDIPVYRYAECSVCDKFVLFPYIYKYTIYDYCPYCGAKMDKVD